MMQLILIRIIMIKRVTKYSEIISQIVKLLKYNLPMKRILLQQKCKRLHGYFMKKFQILGIKI